MLKLKRNAKCIAVAVSDLEPQERRLKFAIFAPWSVVSDCNAITVQLSDCN